MLTNKVCSRAMLLLTIALGLIACREKATGDRQVEEGRALVQRWVEEINSSRSPDVIDKYLSLDYVWHLPGENIRGAEAVKASFARMFSNYPDFNLTAEDVIVEGNTVVVRWTIRGTHKETGKQMMQASISIDRIANGKFLEGWEVVADTSWVSP